MKRGKRESFQAKETARAKKGSSVRTSIAGASRTHGNRDKATASREMWVSPEATETTEEF